MLTDKSRIEELNDKPARADGSAVVYWMQSEQRANDNWALARAVELADELELPMIVAFFVNDQLASAYLRHYDFMLRGLAETATDLRKRGIGFGMMIGDPAKKFADFAMAFQAAVVITDYSYMTYGAKLRSGIAEQLTVRMEAVHNRTIVPPAEAYPKAAYAAHVFRPKLRQLRDRFLTEQPIVQPKVHWTGTVTGAVEEVDVDGVLAKLHLDDSVKPVGLKPGPQAGLAAMQEFIDHGFTRYDEKRNDPVANVTSHLSAYLHFGNISSQRVAWEVINSDQYERDVDAAEAFLDELITWRELAINHCLYTPGYGTYAAVPNWAKLTLESHEHDEREALYTRDELEAGHTHDELWNAAQLEMIKTGRMHGYLRMYWAKKILEWSPNAATAIEASVYMNDKYFLDGRDANGYAGILWSIGGLHDRPWFDRPYYGKVRYMSYGGAKSKFDIKAYVEWVNTQ